MHDEIEILREQISSLKHEIHLLELKASEQQQQMKELEDELRYTNQELCRAVNTPHLNLVEAKNLAKDLIAAENLPVEAIADLLNAIYACEVQTWELAPEYPIDGSSQPQRLDRPKPSTDQRKVDLAIKHARLQAQTENLKEQFISLMQQVKAFRQHSTQFSQHFRYYAERQATQTAPQEPSVYSSVDSAKPLELSD